MKFLPLISAIVLAIALIFLLWKRPENLEQSRALEDAGTKAAIDPVPEEELIPPPTHDYYREGTRTPDGTGKYYLGREIAQVMGHPAINWLERPARIQEENPVRAVDLLELPEDAVIADIGAGSGYYTFRLAMKLEKGQVIAVDIQQEMLDFLEGRKEMLGLKNVSSHLGKIHDTRLQPESIDAALMVDAYHEFSHPYEMMTSIVRALKPGGQVILLEYRANDPRHNIKPLHTMSQEQVKKEMAVVGLEFEKTHDDLPWQHLMIFRKPLGQ